MEAPMDGPRMLPGLSWRIAASILLGVGWFAFFIIWLFFYAGQWDIYQNLAIIIVSFLIVLAILAAMWATWALRWAPKIEGEGNWKREARRYMGWRGIVSSIIWLGWLVWLLIWLFAYAGNYNIYQNIAIFIVSLIVAAGLSGVIWGTYWGGQRRWRM